MSNSALYWFQPADDHPEGILEWQRRNDRPIIAVAEAIDWSVEAFDGTPCIWIRYGTVSNYREIAVQAECVAFECPNEAIANVAREALNGISAAWKLAVTDSRPQAEAYLPVRAALVSGIYVNINMLLPDGCEERSRALGMPVVGLDDEENDLRTLVYDAGKPTSYPNLITLLARTSRELTNRRGVWRDELDGCIVHVLSRRLVSR